MGKEIERCPVCLARKDAYFIAPLSRRGCVCDLSNDEVIRWLRVLEGLDLAEKPLEELFSSILEGESDEQET